MSRALFEFEDVETQTLGVSVLIPTRNEMGNVRPLTQQIVSVLSQLDTTWEVIFLDDSDDATPDEIRELATEIPFVTLAHRERGHRRGGLGGAVVQGFRLARGDVIVVMDGDLQHPPSLVRQLSRAVFSGQYDVAIASRYVENASNDGLVSQWRKFASRVSIWLAHLVVPSTRGVRDPMSGFFAVSRECVVTTPLRPNGFKILMELLGRRRGLRVAEIPFNINERDHGHSKASATEGIRFLRHLARLHATRWRSSAPGGKVAPLIPLTLILAVQAVGSIRLIFRNSAFLDEATYLSAGHYELHILLHGGANMQFPTYFSGAPSIYPVLGALVDSVWGLHGVRFLSLAFMLATTVLCYAVATRLWGRPAGWAAAAVFASTEGVFFLGALATFDAMALMLIALATWIVVRWSTGPVVSNLVFLCVPVLVFANATKYASAIFDPVVFLVAFFVLWQRHDRRTALRVSALLFATFALALGALLAVTPSSYLSGIGSTTVSRPVSTTSFGVVFADSGQWVGAVAVVSAAAVLVALFLAPRRAHGWAHAGLVASLAGAITLAPIEQARLHTLTSLNKHVTFGAWFGAIAVGWLVSLVCGAWSPSLWRRLRTAAVYVVGVVLLVPLFVIGFRQAVGAYGEWANTTDLIAGLRPLVTRLDQPVLMDDAPIGQYYLQSTLPFPDWYGTYYFTFRPPGSSTTLTGIPAYVNAVHRGWFKVIALNWSTQQSVDAAVASAIHRSKKYRWVGDFTQVDEFGRSAYVVWALKGLSS